MSVSVSTRQAFSEIDEFLELLSETKRNAVPQKLRAMFKNEKDASYKKGINPKIPISKQNLKEETLAIIALLNIQYWCKDETKKARFERIYEQNEQQYQEMLKEKYSPNNIFATKEETVKTTQIAEIEEPVLKRILNKILEIFRWK